ncbi:hypothetical protein HK098_001936 [Nowakowskiella sp. JEL0407]|nr:hypothetical protein HK098_001936 [Nowakowskiella sp. JEL0407]
MTLALSSSESPKKARVWESGSVDQSNPSLQKSNLAPSVQSLLINHPVRVRKAVTSGYKTSKNKPAKNIVVVNDTLKFHRSQEDSIFFSSRPLVDDNMQLDVSKDKEEVSQTFSKNEGNVGVSTNPKRKITDYFAPA